VAIEFKERLQTEDGEQNKTGGSLTEQSHSHLPGTSMHAMSGELRGCHPKVQPITLTYSELQEFHTDLLHLFVANNIAIHAIDSVQTELFFKKWVPGPELPNRQALGGRILKSAVKESKSHMLAAVKGKLAVGISDGWSNIRKKALLAAMINVDYKVSQIRNIQCMKLLMPVFEAYTVRITDISTVRKTADNHLQIVKSVINYCEKELDTKIIGWVSDAGGDSRAMRVRLFKEQPNLLLFDCWAHQVSSRLLSIS
jgi:hypothetical protein